MSTSPLFFVSSTEDQCAYDGVVAQLSANTARGALCAYQSATSALFGCPAQEARCWAVSSVCTGSGTDIPGDKQFSCSTNGTADATASSWCCPTDSICPTNGQQGVCLSGFSNPYAAVSADIANRFATASLSAAGTATAVNAVPSATLNAQLSQFLTSSTFPVVHTSSPTSATTAPASQDNSPTAPHRGLSGEVIAGIVVGVIGGLILLAVLIFVCRRLKKNKSQHPPPPPPLAEPPSSWQYVASPASERSYRPGTAAPPYQLEETSPLELSADPKAALSELSNSPVSREGRIPWKQDYP